MRLIEEFGNEFFSDDGRPDPRLKRDPMGEIRLFIEGQQIESGLDMAEALWTLFAAIYVFDLRPSTHVAGLIGVLELAHGMPLSVPKGALPKSESSHRPTYPVKRITSSLVSGSGAGVGVIASSAADIVSVRLFDAPRRQASNDRKQLDVSDYRDGPFTGTRFEWWACPGPRAHHSPPPEKKNGLTAFLEQTVARARIGKLL